MLVGISPSGTITFVSGLWGDGVLDRLITVECCIIDLLASGDNVMADKGFDIQDLLAAKKVKHNIPPFLGKRQRFPPPPEVEETRRIAELRIHVKRAICRIKNFHILNGVFPITLTHIANEIFTTCALLTNFMIPVCAPNTQT